MHECHINSAVGKIIEQLRNEDVEYHDQVKVVRSRGTKEHCELLSHDGCHGLDSLESAHSEVSPSHGSSWAPDFSPDRDSLQHTLALQICRPEFSFSFTPIVLSYDTVHGKQDC